MAEAPDGPALWRDALAAAALLAVDPLGLKGIRLRAPAGPVRDAWLAALAGLLPEAKWHRMTAATPESRLVGGLDLALTLAAGRPVAEQGLLARCDGGVLVAAMAERLTPATAALLGAVLDEGVARGERDGMSLLSPARFPLVALDEGDGADEAPPRALTDRLGFSVDLGTLSFRCLAAPDIIDAARIEEARAVLPGVVPPPAVLEALCALALEAGDASLRRPLLLVRAACAAAALRGASAVEAADAALAARLVLGLSPVLPEEEAESEHPPANAQDEDPARDDGDGETQAPEAVLQAIRAHLPPSLLENGRERPSRRGGAAGRSDAQRTGGRRGARIGLTERPPFPQARLDVLATLRAAAPWQRLRGKGSGERLALRKGDFRFPRLKERIGSTAICVIDASGSAAAERMAEAKGAVEVILSRCYVRRDQVALIAFRGKDAETLLEPTRSLVRAKRSLSALPAGGGTPLAAGLLSALAAALAVRRRGNAVLAVFLTDGRGNVALDGSTASRAQAEADVAAAARRFRAENVAAVVIDTAQRPRGQAGELASLLGARYLALPRAGAHALAGAISGEMRQA